MNFETLTDTDYKEMREVARDAAIGVAGADMTRMRKNVSSNLSREALGSVLNHYDRTDSQAICMLCRILNANRPIEKYFTPYQAGLFLNRLALELLSVKSEETHASRAKRSHTEVSRSKRVDL